MSCCIRQFYKHKRQEYCLIKVTDKFTQTHLHMSHFCRIMYTVVKGWVLHVEMLNVDWVWNAERNWNVAERDYCKTFNQGHFKVEMLYRTRKWEEIRKEDVPNCFLPFHIETLISCTERNVSLCLSYITRFAYNTWHSQLYLLKTVLSYIWNTFRFIWRLNAS
jgi:hypothetical protein